MKQQLKSTLALSAGVLAVVGIALAPTAGAADTTTVTATVAKVASVASTTSPVTLNITPTAAGSYTSASDTVTAGTNSAAGYDLQISAATPALTRGGGGTIAASSGTPGSPVTLANNTWGYRVDNQEGFGAGPYSGQTNQASLTNTWAGVTVTPTQIKTTAVPASADTTTVWFGAAADLTKTDGNYVTTVTYTAIAN